MSQCRQSTSPRVEKGSKNKELQLLEADGIKLIDFDPPEDLRMSLDPLSKKSEETGKFAPNAINDSSFLVMELERVKAERDELKRQKEQIVRDHLNQTLESNLDMKEENQLLREQDIIRNELLTRLEKEQEKMTTEVSCQFKCLNFLLFIVNILQGPKR